MKERVRVRFAPSPTGPLHIGGLRTALFNYLFAKKHQGDFLLRIEDTDQNRFVQGAEEYIVQALEWCGIPFDEGPGKEGAFGPYRQSERKEIYRRHALELVKAGKAYYAFDSPAELDRHRKEHEAQGKTFIYNWHNRNKLDNSLHLSKEEVQKRLDAGQEHVIRFTSPQGEELILNDLIRGEIRIDTDTLDDKILFKGDGMPTYHLANIVDDHMMQISHVIRGEEWLPSLALHQLLYDAFGWKAPEFAHLPLILKPDGPGKLSKRDGDKGGFPIFPFSWEGSMGYREAGYLPQGVVNFLALLGWNPGTEQELFDLEELVEAFSLERVNKAGARFDPEKNKWYNAQWMQRLPVEQIVDGFLETVGSRDDLHLKDHSRTYVSKVVELVRERAQLVPDLLDLTSYFFAAPTRYDDKAAKKHWKADSPEIMRELSALLGNMETLDPKSTEEGVKAWAQDRGLGLGRIMAPLRLLIVGELTGPQLFDIMHLLGKEESLGRIQNGISRLSAVNL